METSYYCHAPCVIRNLQPQSFWKGTWSPTEESAVIYVPWFLRYSFFPTLTYIFARLPISSLTYHYIPHAYLSTLANIFPQLPKFPTLAKIFPQFPKFPTLINIFPHLSIFSHTYQYFPTLINIFPYLLIFFNVFLYEYQYLPKNTNIFPCIIISKITNLNFSV